MIFPEQTQWFKISKFLLNELIEKIFYKTHATLKLVIYDIQWCNLHSKLLQLRLENISKDITELVSLYNIFDIISFQFSFSSWNIIKQQKIQVCWSSMTKSKQIFLDISITLFCKGKGKNYPLCTPFLKNFPLLGNSIYILFKKAELNLYTLNKYSVETFLHPYT